MFRIRAVRLRTAHLLCWVLLMAAVLPTVSRGLAAWQADAAPWSVLCSAADAGFAPASSSEGMADAGHCPLCVLHAQGNALPPPTLSSVARQDLSHSVPLLMWRAPRPLFAWASALSRGPPHRA